jgi:uridylate kinase
MGIAVTKVNAELVRIIFGDKAYEKVIYNPTLKIKTNKKIIIGSGWKPGCSSDMDAVLLAKNLKAKTVINLSNICYVYDKDPKKFKEAKPIKKMSWQELIKIVGGKWTPGLNAPFDPIAAKLCMKLGLEVVIMKGTDLVNLKNFLTGKRFQGTVIC